MILEAFKYIFAIIFAFYVPGAILSSCLKLNPNLVYKITLGIITFSLISYTLSYLNISFLVFPALIALSIIVFKKKNPIYKLISLKSSFDKYYLLISILSLIFSFSMIFTGISNDTIIIRRDDFWHLALITELKNNFPPDNPGFSNIPLKGYHFFFNFLLASISNTFRIEVSYLYFNFFPATLAFIWGFNVYLLVYRWSKNKFTSLLAVFFTMFGGSFSFLLPLFGHFGKSMDDAFGMTQPASSLVNPPFSISIVFLTFYLYSLLNYLESKNYKWIILLSITAGITPMFKVYGGILMFFGILLVILLDITRKRYFSIIGIIISFFIFACTYWIFVGNSGRLIFAPLWAPHKVLVDNLPWYGYEEKAYTYSTQSVIKGIIEIEAYALAVFILGSLGTRTFGIFLALINFIKTKKASSFGAIVFFISLLSLGIPLFFIQSIKAFETIQFTWYFLFLISLFSSFGFSFLLKSTKSSIIKIIISLIIILITLPSAYEKYYEFFHLPKKSTDDKTIQAMTYLKNLGGYNDTVLQMPNINTEPNSSSIRSWFGKSDPLIVYLANKKSYLSSEYIEFPNLPIKSRIEDLENILKTEKLSESSPEYSSSKKNTEEIFKREKIKYIFSSYPLTLDSRLKNISKIYGDSEAHIYEIKN